MKIAVCIKQVPMNEQVAADPVTHHLIRESNEADINPCDLNAIACALQLKQQTGASIDVYSMGPDAAVTSLRKALAMGADRAFLLSDRLFAGGDTLATARVLAAGVQKNGSYDMILTGSESSDGATGQVGPMLAALLNIPDVMNTEELLADTDETVRATRRTAHGKAVLSVQLPALVTVVFGCNQPPLPTLRNQMAARKKEITVYTNDDLMLSCDLIGEKGALSVVTDTIPVAPRKKAQRLTGAIEEIAAQIYTLMEQTGEMLDRKGE